MLLSNFAFAGGTSPFPAQPSVDLSGVAASASVRPSGPDGKPHQVHARLLTRQSKVQPGGTVQVAVPP